MSHWLISVLFKNLYALLYFIGLKLTDRSLSVVGYGTIQVDNGHFNDVLCVPSLSCNHLSIYQITHSGEGKTVEFSPHQSCNQGSKRS